MGMPVGSPPTRRRCLSGDFRYAVSLATDSFSGPLELPLESLVVSNLAEVCLDFEEASESANDGRDGGAGVRSRRRRLAVDAARARTKGLAASLSLFVGEADMVNRSHV